MAILAKHDAGQSVEDICREHQISPATFYKWKKGVADNEDETKRRIKQLELENSRLKKMYAELSIDHEILSDGYEILNLPAGRQESGKPKTKRKNHRRSEGV